MCKEGRSVRGGLFIERCIETQKVFREEYAFILFPVPYFKFPCTHYVSTLN